MITLLLDIIFHWKTLEGKEEGGRGGEEKARETFTEAAQDAKGATSIWLVLPLPRAAKLAI